jgi:protein-L-isoaspartate O-methyltransferase
LRKKFSDLRVDVKHYFKLRFGSHAFPTTPMIEAELLNFLNTKLNKNTNFLEYGSGASTLFISQYVSTLSTVENQRAFARKLRNEIEKQNIQNIHVYTPKTGLTGQETCEC